MIPETGHISGAWIVDKDSDCVSGGTKHQVCSVCGANIKIVEIPAKGHNYVDTVNAPTCTAEGYTTHTCSACGDTYTDSTVSALGHSFTNYVSNDDATCTKNGTKTAKCDRCDVTDTVTDEGSAKGHTPGEWVVDQDSDCVNKGRKHQVCLVCGETIETAEIAAKGHTPVSAENAVVPTCTADGKEADTICSVCKQVLQEGAVIPATEHKWNESHRVNETCTTDGYISFVCENDSTHQKTETIKQTGHHYFSAVTASTCTTDGYTTHTCSSCGNSYIDSIVNASGHSGGKWITDKNPDCINAGRKHQICSVCGTTVAVSAIAANGHAPASAENAVSQTCTNAGKQADTICSVCGVVVRYGTVIKETGHKYSDTITPATCITDGYTTHACSICAESYTDSIVSAFGHTDETATIPATASKDGKAVTACTVCGKVASTVVIPKVSSFKLSATSYTYNGKVQKPTVTVKNSKGITLKNGTDYTVSYASGRKNTGKYAVTITLKGNYTGSKTLYFYILPGKTSSLTASQTTTLIKATWKAVTGASGYIVTLYNSANKVVKTVDTTKTTYTFSKLSAGTVYKVKVTAYKTVDGKKIYSRSYTLLTTATKPGTPTLKVTAGSKKATLSWNKQTGATGYVVYMATSKNGKYTKIATVKGNSSVKFTKSGLTKGKTYYFKVASFETVGGKTVYGSFSSVKYAKIK